MWGEGSSAASTNGNWSSIRFETTRWSVVLAAGVGSSGKAREALADLLRAYWHPLYVFVRRRGYSPEDSQDLIQGFLAQMIEHDRLRFANPERGRFRSFLLTSLCHFLANQQHSHQALKRGGGIRFLPLTGEEMEMHFDLSTSHDLTPEKAFDKHWALALLRLVLERLRTEYELSGRQVAFDLLKPYLEGTEPDLRYAEMAARLKVSESGARMMVHRLRRRYRALINEEIARTLADPSQADQELESLLAALGGAL
jgi:RNA polymerase sigma factor (sigma-70 family)